MAKIIPLKKARREIKFDDAPDSPVYVLDFTDKGIENTCRYLSECYEFSAALAEGGEYDPVRHASIFQKVISSALSEDAYWQIIEYLDADPEEVNVLLTPLVQYLFAEYGEYVSRRREMLRDRYVDEARA